MYYIISNWAGRVLCQLLKALWVRQFWEIFSQEKKITRHDLLLQKQTKRLIKEKVLEK